MIGCPFGPRSRVTSLAALLLSMAAIASITSEVSAQLQTQTAAPQLSVDTVLVGSASAMITYRTTRSVLWTVFARVAPPRLQSSITSSLTAATRSCSGIGRTGSLAASPATIVRQQRRTAGSAGSRRVRVSNRMRAVYVIMKFRESEKLTNVGWGGHKSLGVSTPQTVSLSRRAHPQVSMRGV